MPRNDTDITYDADGNIITSVQVVRDDTRDVSLAALTDRARAAVATNNTYLAIASPTAAQNAAQVKTLTREVTGLIRLLGHVVTELADLGNDTTGT